MDWGGVDILDKVDNDIDKVDKVGKKKKTSNRVNALYERRREMGLESCQVWIPSQSVKEFHRLALLERVKFNACLPSDFLPEKKLVIEPDMFGVVDQSTLGKVKQIVEAASVAAHPTSPRWEYGRRLLKQLQEVL